LNDEEILNLPAIQALIEKAELELVDAQKLCAKCRATLEARSYPEEKMDDGILAMMSAALKKKFVVVGSQGVKVRGFIMGRQKEKDWAEWNREQTIQKIGSMSKEAAIQSGYMNVEGKLLYTSGGKYSIGKPIPEHDYQANGHGIVTFIDKNGKEDTRFANFVLKGQAAVADYPFFTECDMMVKLLDGKDPTKYSLSMFNEPTNFEDNYVNFHESAEYVLDAYEDRILSLGEIETYAQMSAQDDKEKYNNWAIIEGSVIKFGVSQKGNVGVSIDDVSLALDSEDVPSYTIWFPPNTEFDFADDAIGVTFLVTTMVSDDGSVVLFGLGYWVDDFFRVIKTESEEIVPDVQQTWD
jgi:hypothetical protein